MIIIFIVAKSAMSTTTMFSFLISLSFALQVEINDKSYTGDDLQTILKENNIKEIDVHTLKIVEGEFDMSQFHPKDFTSLTTLTVPSASYNGDISANQFQNHPKLEMITMDGVQSIRVSAFEGCQSLKEVVFNACSTIDERAFYDCEKLTKITFSKLETLGHHAFQFTGLIDVELPNLLNFGVDANGEGGHFMSCINLKKFSAPMITYVSDSMFYECESLIEVDAPKVSTIEHDAFGYCTCMSNINFPKLVKIQKASFKECRNLNDVKLDLIDVIPMESFAYCSHLVTASFQHASTVHEYAFSNCVSLTKLSLPEVKTIYPFCFMKTNISEVEFPELINQMQDENTNVNYFFECRNLKKFTAPKIEQIRNKTFMFCDILSELETPKVELVEDYAFAYNTAMKSINLPKLKQINPFAFAHTNLETVNLDSLIYLQWNVMGRGHQFLNCSRLKSFVAPRIQTIPHYAFANCTSLTLINCSSVNVVYCHAFYGCSSLEEISLEKTVTMLGDGFFFNCTSLKTVKLTSLRQIYGAGYSIFGFTPNLKNLYLPSEPPASVPSTILRDVATQIKIILPNKEDWKGYTMNATTKHGEYYWLGYPTGEYSRLPDWAIFTTVTIFLICVIILGLALLMMYKKGKICKDKGEKLISGDYQSNI